MLIFLFILGQLLDSEDYENMNNCSQSKSQPHIKSGQVLSGIQLEICICPLLLIFFLIL